MLSRPGNGNAHECREERQEEHKVPRRERRVGFGGRDRQQERRRDEGDRGQKPQGRLPPDDDGETGGCKDDEDDDQWPVAARERSERTRELRPRASRGGDPLPVPDPDRVALGQSQVGDHERDAEEPHRDHRRGAPDPSAAPENGRDQALGRQEDRPVGMHRWQERGSRCGCHCRSNGSAPQCEDEQVERERCGGGEECVHSPEAPVDAEDGRSGDDYGCRAAGNGPGESPTEVEREDDGREGEPDGEPPESVRRRVGDEREVGENEVERRPAALRQNRVDDLSERANGHQTGHRLVLDQRL